MTGMGYERCETCKEWGWAHSHVCPPQWHCAENASDLDILTDGQLLYAYDAEAAAEKYAEHMDQSSADYLIVNGKDTPVIAVQKDAPGAEIQYFRARGEYVPQYSVEEVEPEEANAPAK